MKDEIRNTRFVAGLIGGTTVCALVLMSLQTRTPRASGNFLLAAEQSLTVDEAAIEYAPRGEEIDLRAFDCVVWPSGELVWEPRGSSIRIAVVGDESPTLPAAQSSQLLNVLGGLRYNAGLRSPGLSLADTSNAALHPELPAQAADLRALLVRKGLIR